MSTLHVKTKGHFLVDGRILVNPGSVVALAKDDADQFVRRGLGALHPGPVSYAPPAAAEEPAEEAPRKPERHDLGSRLAKAEKSVAPAGAR